MIPYSLCPAQGMAFNANTSKYQSSPHFPQGHSLDNLGLKYLLHTHGYLSQNPVKAGEAETQEDSGAYWSGEWVSSRLIEGPCLKS